MGNRATENKTAVTILLEVLNDLEPIKEMSVATIKMLCEQIIDFEKEQTKNAFNQGYRDAEIDLGHIADGDVADCSNADDYFSQTYGGDNG